MIFDINEDVKELNAIVYAKNIIQNASYRIANDLNIKDFLNNIEYNIIRYIKQNKDDGKERVWRSNFEDDLENMVSFLSSMMRSMRALNSIKDKTSDEIEKCCNVFPDNIGKRILSQLSYLPLLLLIKEIVDYEKDLKKYIDDIDFYKKLYSDQIKNSEHIENDFFIDFEKRNKKISEIKVYYEKTRKKSLENSILEMIDLHKKYEKYEIGKFYWDKKAEADKLFIMNLKDLFEEMLNKNKEK